MNISIVGAGYVGLVTSACFAEMGNNVVCIDSNEKKINKLQEGIIPIYEPGLSELIQTNINVSRLSFTTSIKNNINKSDVIFIAVGTPEQKDGNLNLKYVYSVAKEIGNTISKKLIIVNKSTVPIGTNNKIKKIITECINKRKKNISFNIVSNPEFLKEGDAINDFMHPNRIIIGSDKLFAKNLMEKLYKPFIIKNYRIIHMGIKEAEMTKYASNAMLATKISFINEIACICDALNIDIESVRNGIGSDNRIGFSFIYPGIGYGGSCFSKDINSLINIAKNYNINPKILTAINERNRKQKIYLIEKIKKKFNSNLKGKIFTIWGLSFKPDTDDIRHAPSISIINQLIKSGGIVHAFDPIANDIAKTNFPKKWITNKKIIFFNNHYSALNNSNALILATEWKMFRSLDINKMKKKMKDKIIFDGRNQYDPDLLTKHGFYYKGVGR